MVLLENIGLAEPRRMPVLTARRVPAPSPDDPSDDELLWYLDGQMDEAERCAFRERLDRSPYALARVQILADALAENGWPTDDRARD